MAQAQSRKETIASPRVALIQQMLWHGVQRSPRMLQLPTGGDGTGQGAQGAQHLTPAQDETHITRPSLSARRRGKESVAAILQRVTRTHLTQG